MKLQINNVIDAITKIIPNTNTPIISGKSNLIIKSNYKHIHINVWCNLNKTLQTGKMLCVLSVKKCCMVLNPIKVVKNLLVNTVYLLKRVGLLFSKYFNTQHPYTYKFNFLKSQHTIILILSILSYLYYRYECTITLRGNL